jgi:hypothetical protein
MNLDEVLLTMMLTFGLYLIWVEGQVKALWVWTHDTTHKEIIKVK